MDKILLGALCVLWCMFLAEGLWVATGLGVVAMIQTVRIIDLGE